METKTIMVKENSNISKMPKNKKKDHKAQARVQVETQVQAPAQTPNLIMNRKEINQILMKANRKFGKRLKKTIAKDSVVTREWVNKKRREVKEVMVDSMKTHFKTSILSLTLEETKIKKKKQEINTVTQEEVEEEVDVEVEEVASAVEIEVDSMIEDLETEIEEEAAEEEEVAVTEVSMIEETEALTIVEVEVVEEEEEVGVVVSVEETIITEIGIKIRALEIKEKDKASIKASKIKIN